MNVLDAIRRKRAVRQYTGKPLPEEAVQQILEAGRRAQSSKNRQDRYFIAVRDKATLEALSHMGDFAGWIPQAALVVAILTPAPESGYWIMFDAGQAAAYMQLAALDLGVGSCLVTLHHPEPSRALLGYPDDLHLRIVVAFGYPSAPDAFEPPKQAGGRRTQDELIHFEHWKQPDANVGES